MTGMSCPVEEGAASWDCRASVGKAPEAAALRGVKLVAWCKAELGTGAQLWWGRRRERPQRAEHHVRRELPGMLPRRIAAVFVPSKSQVVGICVAWKAAWAPLLYFLFLGRCPWLYHGAGLNLVPICEAGCAGHGAAVISSRVCSSCLLSGQGSLSWLFTWRVLGDGGI